MMTIIMSFLLILVHAVLTRIIVLFSSVTNSFVVENDRIL